MPINQLLRNYLVQIENRACWEFKSLANAVTVQNDQLSNPVDSVELSGEVRGGLAGTLKPGEFLAGTLKPGEFMGGTLKPGEFMGGSLKPGQFMAGTLMPGGFMAGGVMGFMAGGSPRT